jgi:hypothetical protein
MKIASNFIFLIGTTFATKALERLVLVKQGEARWPAYP